MMAKGQNSLLLKAFRGEPVDRAPVWIMRQAGRYLPEYMEIRDKYDFETMYKTPEIAVEISMQPVDRLGVDAAIIFSDIMVIPEAMGLRVEFVEGKGPVFDYPLNTEERIRNLGDFDNNELKYVFDSVKMLREELSDDLPLIGFSGAPFTLAKYMVDGGNLKTNRHIKELRFGRPVLLHKLLERITDAIIEYTKEKIKAGAQLIQLFDSSAGILDERGFFEFAYPYTKKIFKALENEPAHTLYFSRSTFQWLDRFKDIGSDGISLDWTISPENALKILGPDMPVQGSLDPGALYTDPKEVRRLVREMIGCFKGFNRHIANLGHGLLPDIPVPSVQEFVDAVKEESYKIYSEKAVK